MKFYGYKKCGTSTKAEKWLQSNSIPYEFTDVTEKPPSAAELKRIAAAAGIPAAKMFNTSGEAYRSENIKEKIPNLKESEIFSMLASNGRLIKRPLITDGKKATVGFKEESFSDTWKK